MSSEKASWDRKERRKVDPERKGLPLEVHAGRALDRFTVEESREDFNETTAEDFTEGYEMKKVLAEFLEKIEIREPVDVATLADKQYEASKTLTPLREGDTDYPSIENVKKVLESFTPEQLEVINQMQAPILQLMPVTSGERYLEDLNTNKPMREQVDADVSNWTKRRILEKADERDDVLEKIITGWRVAITEGANAPELLDGDDVTDTLGERRAWFAEVYGPKDVTGVDLKRYIKLQQAGLAGETPRPVDDVFGGDDTWTVLNGEPIGEYNDLVVGGYWVGGWADCHCRMHLRETRTNIQDCYAHFRVSVMADVPKFTFLYERCFRNRQNAEKSFMNKG